MDAPTPQPPTPLDAGELQALIRYHCSTVVEAIDDGGIKPSKWDTLWVTICRIRQLAQHLKNMPVEKRPD